MGNAAWISGREASAQWTPPRTTRGRRICIDRGTRRRAGLTLDAALARARSRAGRQQSSIFATVSSALPHVSPVVRSKRTMLAVSRAIEDEAATRAEHSLFLGAFQEPRFWRASADRWAHLIGGSDAAVVLGSFRILAGVLMSSRSRFPQVHQSFASGLSCVTHPRSRHASSVSSRSATRGRRFDSTLRDVVDGRATGRSRARASEASHSLLIATTKSAPLSGRGDKSQCIPPTTRSVSRQRSRTGSSATWSASDAAGAASIRRA